MWPWPVFRMTSERHDVDGTSRTTVRWRFFIWTPLHPYVARPVSPLLVQVGVCGLAEMPP